MSYHECRDCDVCSFTRPLVPLEAVLQFCVAPTEVFPASPRNLLCGFDRGVAVAPSYNVRVTAHVWRGDVLTARGRNLKKGADWGLFSCFCGLHCLPQVTRSQRNCLKTTNLAGKKVRPFLDPYQQSKVNLGILREAVAFSPNSKVVWLI